MLEYGYRIYDEHKQPITVSTDSVEGLWLPRWFGQVYDVMGRIGGSLDAARNLHAWVKNIPAFKDVVHKEFWVPLSPWLQGDDAETKSFNEHGSLMRNDVKVGSFLVLLDGHNC
jgi:hypothetical protein